LRVTAFPVQAPCHSKLFDTSIAWSAIRPAVLGPSAYSCRLCRVFIALAAGTRCLRAVTGAEQCGKIFAIGSNICGRHVYNAKGKIVTCLSIFFLFVD